jgi:hypothetical protein
MNSVIEQLAEQAAEAVVAFEHDVMLRVEHEEGATLEVPADFIFKFAQLMVQEFTDACLYGDEHADLRDAVQHHFGGHSVSQSE